MSQTASPRQGPLAGLKVIELVGLGPGPYCGMLLADLGADVIQIDRPGGASAAYDISTKADILARGRRSVVLNLKDPAAREQALALIADADALIEGNRPGVAERLGLGPDDCLARNPRLVYGRITGWGQSGPLAQHAGHDVNYIALSGVLGIVGAADRPPTIPHNFIGDMGGGGLLLAFGIVSAVLEAKRTGLGQVVDAAMIDGAASQMAGVLTMNALGRFNPARESNMADGGAHYYQCYRTKDGGYLAVGCIEKPFYDTFLREAGLTDPAFADQHNAAEWPRLKHLVAARMAERTRDEWAAVFSSEACVTPVLTVAEMEAHPHNAERQTFFRDGGVLQPSPAPRFSRTPGKVAWPPRPRGADTEAVLAELAGKA